MSATPEAFRLGPRGRGPERRRGGLRARARRSALRHGARRRAQARRGSTRSRSRRRASSPPASLPFCTSEHYDRAAHTYGKSYPELARGLARDYANAPDVVAYPRDESDVAAVLDWAGSADATVTPFGGGSSVCGGVEPQRGTATRAR